MRIFNVSWQKSRFDICCNVVGLLAFAILFFSVGSSFESAFAQNSSSSSSSRNSNSNSNNNNNNDNNDDDDEEDTRENLRELRWGYRSVVGGFLIDSESSFRNATKEEIANLNDSIRSEMDQIPAELDQPCDARKISLRRLDDVLQKSAENKTPLSDAVRYLGGLTAIEYVVAVPEENDIYLVGPAEGWTVSDEGTIVGKKSGKPILLLEDLLTVFRAWNTETPELISCSIDPSADAVQRMSQVAAPLDVAAMETANRNAMGLMNVRFSGIPAGSRMAKVLAAADYRMKQLSLGFDESNLKNFSSYFSMIKGKRNAGYGQRFWISPEYKTVYHDSEQLVWNVSEAAVQTLTERAYFDQFGSVQSSEKKDAAAEKWAKNMTDRYAELAKVEPIFAEAKNCMDLALVVALIYYQNLAAKADCSWAALNDSSVLTVPNYDAPKTVPSDSLVRVLDSRGSYVAVTGGVWINPWETVKNNVETNVDLNELKSTLAFSGNEFWSN